MEFQFPKDEELFQDLATVREERSYWEETLLDDGGKASAPTFGEEFRKVLKKLRATKAPTLEARGETYGEVDRKLAQKRNAHFQDRYEELEVVADKFADKKKIGAFPESAMGTITYTDKHGDSTDYKLDYFSEMNKAFGFMTGVGRVGSFMEQAQVKLDTIKRKNLPLSGFTLILLFVGIVVFLAGATPFDFLPQIVVELVNEYLGVRLAVLAMMALMGWFLVMGGPPEEGSFLFKFFANGICLFLVAIGSTLIAMRSAFSESPIDAIELLPFGAYYIIYGLFGVCSDIYWFFKRIKAARQAKKDFCALVEHNILHMHRYIRFHTLWWQKQNEGEPIPVAITKLEKSFTHLLKMYKKYR